MKKVCLILVILTLIFSGGCSIDQSTVKTPSEIPEQEKNEHLNSDSKPMIIEEAVSPDGNYKAYIVSQDSKNRVFLGQGNSFRDAKEIDCDIDDIQEIKWSPNSQFFFARNAHFGMGAVFSVNDLNYIPLWFESGPFWSPDGYKLCFSKYSEVWSSSKEHSVITFDIVVEDLMAPEHLVPTVFARGTEEFYYKVNDWDKNGEIKHERRSREDHELLANLASQYAHYLWSINISSETRQEMGKIPDLGYLYFNISPDKKWLSMVKLTFSGGEAEGGIPTFYNLETGELRDLGKEFDTWFWDPEWFGDSTKIMLNEASIYDISTGKLTEYDLPSDKIWLGAKPSPEGSKLAVIGCNRVHHTGSKGEQLIVYMLDLDGKVLKTIQTPLLPNYSDNVLLPLPVNFDWLADGQNLIIEAWNQNTYATTLQKLNLASGEISQLAINTYSPLLSPDGKKIAVFSTDKPEKHVVYNKLHILDTEGKTLSSFGINGGDYTMWDNDSDNILILGYSGDYSNKILTNINIDSGDSTSFKVEDSINPLYLENEDIVCVGGPLI